MKIAIPVDEKSGGSNVSVSFGRAPYFLIYDIESKENSFIENPAQVIEAAHIKIYKSQGNNLKENIDKFINDELPILDEVHSGFHGHGGS